MQILPHDHDSEDDQLAAVGPPARQAVRLTRRLWKPAPVPKPEIATDLEQLGWPERSAEVVRHTLLSIEHWLSQGGWLREWIRLNLWLAVVLIVATVLVVPPVTALLEGFRDWTALVSSAAGNINTAISTLPAIILSLATGFLVVKLILRHRGNRQQQRRPPYSPYE